MIILYFDNAENKQVNNPKRPRRHQTMWGIERAAPIQAAAKEVYKEPTE